jgi:hypothetical protein
MATPQKAIESLYSVNVSIKGTPLPPIPRAQVKNIIERDALSCLGINYAAIPRNSTANSPSDSSKDAIHQHEA